MVAENRRGRNTQACVWGATGWLTRGRPRASFAASRLVRGPTSTANPPQTMTEIVLSRFSLPPVGPAVRG